MVLQLFSIIPLQQLSYGVVEGFRRFDDIVVFPEVGVAEILYAVVEEVFGVEGVAS